MTIEQRVKNYLEREPKARERQNRSRAVANLLLEDYPDFLPYKDKLIDLIHSAESYNRLFRKCQLENKDLRGEDYDVMGSKKILEQRKQIELGYEPNYYENVKMLKKLWNQEEQV